MGGAVKPQIAALKEYRGITYTLYIVQRLCNTLKSKSILHVGTPDENSTRKNANLIELNKSLNILL